MTTDDIPSAVRDLLREHIETYQLLEVLLLLGRDKDREWTAEAVAADLGISIPMASETLAALGQAGLVSCSSLDVGGHFSCRADSSAVNDLVEACRVNRIGVMRLMNANALDRVRTSALRAFTSAFLLGKQSDG